MAQMESHQQALEGKDADWQRQLYNEVFSSHDEYKHISSEAKVRNRVTYLKDRWRKVQRLWIDSEWEERKEDNSDATNQILETKCPFYWRFEAIWGTRPNSRAIVRLESTSDPLAESSQTPKTLRPLAQRSHPLLQLACATG